MEYVINVKLMPELKFFCPINENDFHYTEEVRKMPGFDGTGPSGLGPMTGRGFGYCALPMPGAGYAIPPYSYANYPISYPVAPIRAGMPAFYAPPYAPPLIPRFGMGFGRGRGWGRGYGRGFGMGRGRGRWFY